MDSSKVGFTLDFANPDNINDPIYYYCFKKFIIFHFLLIMFLISLLRTVLTDPGFLSKEYVKLYIFTYNLDLNSQQFSNYF